jgi:hypothetical protein
MPLSLRRLRLMPRGAGAPLCCAAQAALRAQRQRARVADMMSAMMRAAREAPESAATLMFAMPPLSRQRRDAMMSDAMPVCLPMPFAVFNICR